MVEWVALKISVVAGLQPGDAAAALEIARPSLLASDADREAMGGGRDREGGIARRVSKVMALADIVAAIALEMDVAARRWGRSASRLPEAGRRVDGPGRLRGIARVPVDLAVQGRRLALAVLLEAEIDRHKRRT